MSSLLIPLTGTGPRAAFFAAGTGLMAAGIVIGNIVAVSFRQAYCPPDMIGRVTASGRFLAYGASPLGALVAGALGTAFGVRTALWLIVTVFALSSTLLLASRMRQHRDLPGRVPQPTAQPSQPMA
jgi:hypothetical protein